METQNGLQNSRSKFYHQHLFLTRHVQTIKTPSMLTFVEHRSMPRTQRHKYHQQRCLYRVHIILQWNNFFSKNLNRNNSRFSRPARISHKRLSCMINCNKTFLQQMLPAVEFELTSLWTLNPMLSLLS